VWERVRRPVSSAIRVIAWPWVGRHARDRHHGVVEIDGVARRQPAGDEGGAVATLEIGVDEDVRDGDLAGVDERARDLVEAFGEVRGQLQAAVPG
jgi:hypothetical protein